MENKMREMLLDSGFLTIHYNLEGKKVYPLSNKGLRGALEYMKQKNGKFLSNVELIIDEAGTTPYFSTEMQDELKQKFTEKLKEGERKYYIVHRDGHTSLVAREDNVFVLVDSYNAFGSTDNDHFPVLRIIRDNNPNAEILVNHDKFQNDYYNCRVFALLSAQELERACQNKACSLNTLLKERESDVLYNLHISKKQPKLMKAFGEREDFYNKYKIQTLGLPLCLLPLWQSISNIEELDVTERLVRENRKSKRTYKSWFEKNLVDKAGKKTAVGEKKFVNCLVNNKAQKICKYLYDNN